MNGYRSRQTGLTLIELVIVLAAALILVTIGLPFSGEMISNNRMVTQTNDLIAQLHFARSEAIKRGDAVSVCASVDGVSCSGATNWEDGWIVFTDGTGADGQVDGGDTILRISLADGSGGVTISGNKQYVRYLADGSMTTN